MVWHTNYALKYELDTTLVCTPGDGTLMREIRYLPPYQNIGFMKTGVNLITVVLQQLNNNFFICNIFHVI